MKRIFKITFIITAMTLFLGSCIKDLDKGPIDPNTFTSANVYDNPAAYKQVLARLYAGLSVSGQQGPSGDPDISGIDEGFGQYIRAYWYHQELTTDEAVIGWNDQTIKNFHAQAWGSGDVFIAAMYYRIFVQISMCNEFIRESTNDKLASRNITGDDLTNIGYYRAEARFLRALSYYHALDLFANVPFVTENDKVEKFFPPQIKRADLFDYIESELKAIEPLMKEARTNDFGRADKACVWTLLAKLYLNAPIYNGADRNTDCITYCKNVIDAGYVLDPEYQYLFLADNYQSTEIIFPVEFDGVRTQTWGGTTFITHSAVGGSMVPADYGVGGGWGGTRTTKAFVQKFFPDLKKSFWSSPIPPKSPKTYPVIYAPGSYQGWDPAVASCVQLASVLSDGNYEAYIYFPDAGGQFKFTQGPDWTVNWGDDGADGTLEVNGANLSLTDAGYYKVNVNLNTMTYTLTKTTWGIIGSASPGGWDTDTPMTYDSQTGEWKATVNLTLGDVKFRANAGWDINYGDTGPNGILDAGGDNIAIPEAGSYNIVMKLGTPDYTYSIVKNSYDKRAMFWTAGQNLDIDDIGAFTDGYAITKFKNITRDGAAGSNPTYVDIDFPMFRLADVYLMYAEAVLRGGTGGDLGTALGLVNDLRKRAYGDTGGNISLDKMTLQFILDERGRELYWEGVRRTDLIRYGQFTTGAYLWPWKGDIKEGRSTDAKYNIFPIPSTDITSNPNLVQNTGY
jgi:hypothetical protein